MERHLESENKPERLPMENEDADIYKIEEIKIEEMAIDGICGVY
jgi:mycofactocin precursor